MDRVESPAQCGVDLSRKHARRREQLAQIIFREEIRRAPHPIDKTHVGKVHIRIRIVVLRQDLQKIYIFFEAGIVGDRLLVQLVRAECPAETVQNVIRMVGQEFAELKRQTRPI